MFRGMFLLLAKDDRNKLIGIPLSMFLLLAKDDRNKLIGIPLSMLFLFG